jgi:hypothetical protein
MYTVVARHIADVASEFLSILDFADEEVRVVLTGMGGLVVDLPQTGAEKRLRSLAERLPAAARDVTALELPRPATGSDTWWAHNPADWRAPHARSGLLAAQMADGQAVRHAVGYAGHSQFVVDRAHPLPPELLRIKLAFLNTSVPDRMTAGHGREQVTTVTVPACEQFFSLRRGQAEHLHYLLYSPHAPVSVPEDPWGLTSSEYERARLSATRDWVRAALPAPGSVLVEPGACEGALTALLCESGYAVVATEPNPGFRHRLERHAGQSAEVTAETVEDLARSRRVPADAYLLAELVYYLDDLSVLDALPTDLLLITAPPELVESTVLPWLAGAGRVTWAEAARVTLVVPRLDFLVENVAYQRKRGSIGLVCRRR